MTVSVEAGDKLSLEQIRAFLDASDAVGFRGQDREEVYGWVNQALRQQGYQDLKRSGRGLVRRYLEKMTGLSRAQTTRLITLYLSGEEVRPQPYRRHRFAQRYTRADVEALAGIDELHETLSGPATQKLMQRAYYDFGEAQYQRLAQISVAQILSAAAEPAVSGAAGGVSADTADTGVDRGAAAAGAQRAAGVPAGRHGASRGSGRRERGLSHQRGG